MTDNIDPDTINYFNHLIETIENLNQAKDTTVKYLLNNEIKDKQKIENCIIISQVWAMNRMGKLLTLNDLMVFLGGDEEISNNDTIDLDPSLIGLGLNEVLDIIITKKGPILG